MVPACKVTAKFLRTSPRLRHYLTGIFLIEIEVEDDGLIEDFMCPDWTTLRFNNGPSVDGRFPFSVSGPRSQEVYLRTGSLRQWGAVIHPLGWALLIGEPAHEYANQLLDGAKSPAFAKFRPLAETLFGPEPDPEGELQRLTRFFEGLEPLHDPAVANIVEVYRALHQPEIETVTQLAARGGISRRTLERLCQRAFGFAPKMLLRRQRFLRSLIDFTVDPSLKWIDAMDAAYHDQSQFVRDFHEFMGMTPTEYGQLTKPIVEPVIRARVRYVAEYMRELRTGDGWREIKSRFGN